MFDLPYRVVFAVATTDAVIVYDTSEPAPLFLCGELHLASINDLAWSPDARYLAVASTDGFCSVIAFDDGDLGKPFPHDQLPESVRGRLDALVDAETTSKQ